MRFIEVNKHFQILQATKLFCCLYSLFNIIIIIIIIVTIIFLHGLGRLTKRLQFS